MASFAKQANKVRFLTFICKEVAFTELNWLRFAYCYYIVGFPRSTASLHVLNDNRQTYLPDGKTWKVSENFRRLPKTFMEDPKMFRWYTYEFKYNLRDKLDITEVIDNLHMWRYHIFTCEDIVSFLSICYHSLYHWLFYNKIQFALTNRHHLFPKDVCYF